MNPDSNTPFARPRAPIGEREPMTAAASADAIRGLTEHAHAMAVAPAAARTLPARTAVPPSVTQPGATSRLTVADCPNLAREPDPAAAARPQGSSHPSVADCPNPALNEPEGRTLDPVEKAPYSPRDLIGPRPAADPR